jgi:hypothetical protein
MRKYRPIFTLIAAVTLLVCTPTNLRAESDAGPEDEPDSTIEQPVGFHTYINIGQAWGHQSATGRVDASRYLALPGLGIDFYPSSKWRIGLSGESIIGLIIPSLILRGTADFHPLGSQSDGPFATFGVRWVAVSPAIICQNDHRSCTDVADRAETERQNQAADAIGPTINGALGEIGFGYQARLNSVGLYALASYQGGLLGPTPGSADSDAPPLEGYYHGYLLTLGLHTF